MADMLTANPQDVEQRVKEDFLALLMQGPTADEAIRIGRAAAGDDGDYGGNGITQSNEAAEKEQRRFLLCCFSVSRLLRVTR